MVVVEQLYYAYICTCTSSASRARAVATSSSIMSIARNVSLAMHLRGDGYIFYRTHHEGVLGDSSSVGEICAAHFLRIQNKQKHINSLKVCCPHFQSDFLPVLFFCCCWFCSYLKCLQNGLRICFIRT